MTTCQSPSRAAWLILVILALLLGCGSNDNSSATSPYTKITGNPSDPVYLNIRDEIGFSTVYSQGIMKDIFDMLADIAPSVFPVVAGVGSSGTAKLTADTAEYDDASGYWIRSYTDTSGLVDRSLTTYVDSVQFLQGGTAVRVPDSALLTAIKMSSRHSLTYLERPDSVAYSLQTTLSGPAGVLAAGGNITISGTGFYVGFLTNQAAAGPDTACDRTFAYTIRLQDLHANVSQVFYGQGCPTSGIVRHTGILVATCSVDSLNYDQQWIGVATYNGQQIKFTIENLSTRWIYQTTCDAITAPPAISGPREVDSPFLAD